MLAKSERIALFSDGINLYTAVKSLGLDIDYKRLPVSFSRAVICYGLVSYRRVRGSRRRFNSAANPWLEYNSYTVVTKTEGVRRSQRGGARLRATWTLSSQ